jgi:hypothetical protein
MNGQSDFLHLVEMPEYILKQEFYSPIWWQDFIKSNYRRKLRKFHKFNKNPPKNPEIESENSFLTNP